MGYSLQSFLNCELDLTSPVNQYPYISLYYTDPTLEENL